MTAKAKKKKKQTETQKLRQQLGELQQRAYAADNFYQDMRDLVHDERMTSGRFEPIDTDICEHGYEIHQGDEYVYVQSRKDAEYIVKELKELLDEDKNVTKAQKVFQKP